MAHERGQSEQNALNKAFSDPAQSFNVVSKGFDGVNYPAIKTDPYGVVDVKASLPNKISTLNSTSTPLGINGIFTGQWEDVTDYIEISVAIFASVPSLTDGLKIEWSADGINVHGDDVFTISANSGKAFNFPRQNRYVRVRYFNDGVAQASFNIETILSVVASKGSSHRLLDTLVEQDDAIVTKSLIAGHSTAGGGSIQDVKVTPSGALTSETIIKNVAGSQINPSTEETVAKIPGLSIPIHDYISASYNDPAFTETYTYKTGGSTGTVVATITVVYTDATKNKLVSVTKT